MAPLEKIGALLERGPALTAADVETITYELTQLDNDEAREAEPWVWEGVALIVNDPDYVGDAKPMQ